MSSADLITLNNVELTRTFFAMVVLLVSAHGFGYFVQRFGIPKVIGEILGGLFLGPTCLGFFAPSAYQWLFNAFPSEGKLISMIYWIGLVLLMFLSGFEIQKEVNRDDKKLISSILLGATAVSFLAGWLAPNFYDFSSYLGAKGNMISLKIVIAIAVAVTSIPVISKIFIDLGIVGSRFAKIVLIVATIEDVILYVALAIATGLVAEQVLSFPKILSNVFIALAFFAVTLLGMPRLIAFLNRSRFNLLMKSSVAGYTLCICFLFAAVASILNVNVVFGAFLAGIVIGMMPSETFGTVKTHIKEVGLGFFTPIYFAVVGLKLDLIHHFDPLFFLGFLLFATFFKTIGTVVSAKGAGEDWLSSFNFGVAMNARGGPGIVLATVAFDLGIINETFFAVLVVLAIVTSLTAGYWFRFVLSRGWKL